MKNTGKKSVKKATSEKTTKKAEVKKTAVKKMNLEKAVDQFLLSAQSGFSLNQITEAVKPLLTKAPRDLQQAIQNALLRNPWVFWCDKTSKYLLCRDFFEGTKFAIVPLPEEIARGVLIPGHRFMPFSSPDIFPPKFKLSVDGVALRRKKTTWIFKDVVVYHSLFGQEQMLGYLIYDCEENASVFTSPNVVDKEITLTTFNMQKLYDKYKFEAGDVFIATVEDWQKGEYSLKYVPGKDFKQTKTTMDKLSKALDKSFARQGAGVDIHEQLCGAYFRLGKEFLIKNPIHLGGFLANSKDIEITNFGLNTILWRTSESPEDVILRDPVFHQYDMSGAIESIDAIMEDLGLSCTEAELEAYMRDELYQQRNSLENAIERCLPGINFVEFYDASQKKEFHKLLEKLWTKIKNNYNVFMDKIAGKYRNQSLEILDKHRHWVNSLNFVEMVYEDFPQREMLALSQMISGLKQFAESLNEGDASCKDEKNLENVFREISFGLQGLQSRIEQQINAVRAYVPGIAGASSKAVVDEKVIQKAKDTVYRMRISLLGTDVWRTVDVKGDSTLGDLHGVIQDVMPWEYSHMHVFVVNGVEYSAQSPFEMDDFEMEDEEEVILAEIISKKNQKFFYEYDFGDSWEHEVKVIDILKPEKGKFYPVCVDGKNACPPEDCGGVPGYHHLLEVMKNKKHPEYNDLKEWLDGEFDPHYFNLKEVNKELKNS